MQVNSTQNNLNHPKISMVGIKSLQIEIPKGTDKKKEAILKEGRGPPRKRREDPSKVECKKTPIIADLF
uniref:Uncharacterized protein n=1 Tax=Rhizophora mucronata TaxID=61149 RepID=A0A2P2IRX4_RHIMU